MRIWIIMLFLPAILRAQDVEMNGARFLQRELTPFESAQYHNSRLERARFSLIEKLEFRTETHDFLPENQEYLVRISPSSFAERKSRKAIYQKWQKKPDLQPGDQLCDISFDLQEEWLWLWQSNRTLSGYEQLILLYNRMDSLYRTGPAAPKLESVLKLRNKLHDQVRKKQKLEEEINGWITHYGIRPDMLDFSDRRTLDTLIGQLNSLSDFPRGRSLASTEFDLEMNALEQRLEHAENRQVLDFVQMRFQGPQSDPFSERASLGIGFILPNSGNRKLNLKELEVEALELENEKRLKTLEREKERQKKWTKLKADYDHYQFLKASVAEENARLKNMTTQLFNETGFDEESYFLIEERILELERDIWETEYGLYRDVLDFYKSTELLCEEIYLNRLFGN
jgi:hypothetical protein